MKIAVFDTNDTIIKTIEENFASTEFQLDFDKKLLSPDDDFEKLNVKDYDAVLINIEAPFHNENRLGYAAIEIIFRLRIICAFGKPIILTGFQTLLSILKQKPTATVLNAKNVYFIDILSDFTALNYIFQSPTNLTKEEIRSSYLPHAKNTFDIAAIRHEEANWFAAKVLWDIDNHSKREQIDYPEFIKFKLATLNNVLAGFLYLENNSSVTTLKTINSFLKDKFEELKNKNQNKLTEADIVILDDLIEKNKKTIQSKESEIIEYKRYNQESAIPTIETEINKLQDEIEDAKNMLQENQKIEEHTADSSKFVYDDLLKQYPALDNKVKQNRKTKILLIDDFAQQFWQEVYAKVLEIELKTVKFSESDTLAQLKQKIDNDIDGVDLVFLDLMLFKDDKSKSFTEYSGVHLLRYLRENYVGIPILVTSASNKIWNFKNVMNNGASAYWLKEGIDNTFNFEKSVNNYIELQQTVKIFKTKPFTLLSKMRKYYLQLNNSNNSFWWQNKKWNQEKSSHYILRGKSESVEILTETKVDKEQVVMYFKQIVDSYQTFLSDKILKGKEIILEEILISSIEIQIAKIIELLHPFKIRDIRYPKQISYAMIAGIRGDVVGKQLYKNRNTTAHHQENQNRKISFSDLYSHIVSLSEYLTKENLSIDLELIKKSIILNKKDLEDFDVKKAKETLQIQNSKITQSKAEKETVADDKKEVEKNILSENPKKPKTKDVSQRSLLKDKKLFDEHKEQELNNTDAKVEPKIEEEVIEQKIESNIVSTEKLDVTEKNPIVDVSNGEKPTPSLNTNELINDEESVQPKGKEQSQNSNFVTKLLNWLKSIFKN